MIGMVPAARLFVTTALLLLGGVVESFSPNSRFHLHPSKSILDHRRNHVVPLNVLNSNGSNDGNRRETKDLYYARPAGGRSRSSRSNSSSKRPSLPKMMAVKENFPFIVLVVSTLATCAIILALGSGEALAEASSSNVKDLARDAVAALVFCGDVFGSILNLMFQVLLVILPIVGKALVTGFQAALPVIQEGAQALFEFSKGAAKASGEAAMPILQGTVAASTPYLQQAGASVNDAVQSVVPDPITSINAVFQNVAGQADAVATQSATPVIQSVAEQAAAAPESAAPMMQSVAEQAAVAATSLAATTTTTMQP